MLVLQSKSKLLLCSFLITLTVTFPTFDEYVEKYDKSYDPEEYQFRKSIYNSRIEQMSNITSYQTGTNKFTDWTDQEMQKHKNAKPSISRLESRKTAFKSKKKIGSSTPSSLDWRQSGVITSMKDQGSCGSCWAFGALANAESTLILNKQANIKIDLSEQYLVHCTYESNCDGTYYVEYVMDELLEGCPTQAQYPYNPYSNPGEMCSETNKVHIADNHYFYYDLNDAEMIQLLQSGPQTVTISADGWEYYSSGIFECEQFPSLNHVVLLIGYTSSYWILKNQWGKDWGENGYMKLSRDRSKNCRLGSQVFEFEKLGCFVNGCKTCQTGSPDYCQECYDSKAIETDGKCLCPENYRLSNDKTCQLCEARYCEQCSENSNKQCEICESGCGLQLIEGQCVCSEAGYKPNEKGVCSPCDAEGCQNCLSSDSNYCISCEDCRSFLDDGLCNCPLGGYYNGSSTCSGFERFVSETYGDGECNLIGCQSCNSSNSQQCQSCVDWQWTDIIDGKCICWWSQFERPNTNGICTFCFVTGCASCVAGEYQVCHQCQDSEAFIEDGYCKCPQGFNLNENGICQQCNVVGCQECMLDDSQTCSSCGYGLIFREGKCKCVEYSFVFNLDDRQCVQCHTSGCKNCDSSLHLCYECLEGFELKQGKCLCSLASHSPNNIDTCSPCLIEGCLSCSYSDPYKCLFCDQGFTLQNSECQCQNFNYLMNTEGVCEECNVEGCASCVSGNPNLCARCKDCNTALSNGQCSCLFDPYINEKGLCSFYNSSHQDSMKQQDSKQKITSSQDSECDPDCDECSNSVCRRCKEGYGLKENKCIKCHHTCEKCSDPEACLICKEGWQLVNKKCVQCEERNCAICEGHKCLKYKNLKSQNCESDWKTFEEYQKQFNKTYSTEKERSHRKEIYQAKIQEYSSLCNEKFHFSINKFTDLTAEEEEKRNGFKRQKSQSHKKSNKKKVKMTSKIGDYPQELNWKDKGAVTSVKDQGFCGSCWAFSAAAVAQSTVILNQLYTNQTIDLSEQYLVHCTYDSDCDGTYYLQYSMNEVLEGLPLQSTYPYDPFVENSGICSTQDKIHIASQNYFYYDLTDSQVIALLQKGPLNIVVSATGWNSYGDGIFQCDYNPLLNHAVLLVGYTSSYWIVKNQWGENWGENGYIKITRNSNYNCGIGVQVFEFHKISCEVSGCDTCTDGNSQECSVCADESAEIIDGKCICEDGKGLSKEGMCEPCRVLGCTKCENQDSQICIQCSTGQDPTSNGTFCPCEEEGYLVNINNVCELCSVEGCKLCATGNSEVCQSCSDCKTFIIDGKCECREGYFMSNGECKLCKINSCRKCKQENGNEVCLQCRQETVQVDGKCVCSEESQSVEPFGLCITCNASNCISCNILNSSNCQTCKETFIQENGLCICPVKTFENESNSCQQCQHECQTCDADGCSSCHSSATFEDGKCVCKKENQRMSEEGRCENCYVPGCSQCKVGNPQVCIECGPEMSIEDGLCVCDQELQKINYENVCETCQVSGCLSCQVGDPSRCSKCVDCDTKIINGQCLCQKNLYSRNSEGQCVFSELQHCVQLGQEEDECGVCKKNFTQTDGKCYCQGSNRIINRYGQCMPCNVVNCDYCNEDDPNICEFCSEGYAYFEQNGKCLCPVGEYEKDESCVPITSGDNGYFQVQGGVVAECLSGCGKCESLDSCIYCLDYFYLDDDKCTKCHSTCKTCENSLSNGCLSCHDKFYLESKECKMCSENCLQCDSLSCTLCEQGYFVNDGVCKECEGTCKECTENACTNCELGYGLTNQGQCVQCLSTCNKCSGNDITQCQQCLKGFYLLNNVCEKCEQMCSDCSSANVCLECVNGYYLDEDAKTCKKSCSDQCYSCSYDSSEQTCLECMGGYSENNGNCEPDYSCNTGQNCKICPEKSALVSGVCQNCTTNSHCVFCKSNDLSKCIECVKGYYIQNSQCQACPQQCISCSTQYSCQQCQAGHYMIMKNNVETGICQSCKGFCKTCSGEAEKCETCIDGYYLQGWKCITNIEVTFFIKINTSWSSFIVRILEFRTQLLSLIGGNYRNFDEAVTIKTVKNGSVILEGSLQVQDQNQGEKAYNSLSNQITQFGDFMGFVVLESYFEKSNFEKQNDEEEEDIDKTNNLGLIIGCAVGGVVVIAAIVVIICCKIKKNREQTYKECNNKSTQKKVSSTKKTSDKGQSQNQIGYPYFGTPNVLNNSVEAK